MFQEFGSWPLSSGANVMVCISLDKIVNWSATSTPS